MKKGSSKINLPVGIRNGMASKKLQEMAYNKRDQGFLVSLRGGSRLIECRCFQYVGEKIP